MRCPHRDYNGGMVCRANYDGDSACIPHGGIHICLSNEAQPYNREIDRLRTELAAKDAALRSVSEIIDHSNLILIERQVIRDIIIRAIGRNKDELTGKTTVHHNTTGSGLYSNSAAHVSQQLNAAHAELAAARDALKTWDTPSNMGLLELAKAIKSRVIELEQINEGNKRQLSDCYRARDALAPPPAGREG